MKRGYHARLTPGLAPRRLHHLCRQRPKVVECARLERQFDLPPRIIAQAADDDLAHLVAQSGEAAEVIEDAALAAPEEYVGVSRQLVAMLAQLEPLLRTMVRQVAVDDAILQHAAE